MHGFQPYDLRFQNGDNGTLETTKQKLTTYFRNWRKKKIKNNGCVHSFATVAGFNHNIQRLKLEIPSSWDNTQLFNTVEELGVALGVSDVSMPIYLPITQDVSDQVYAQVKTSKTKSKEVGLAMTAIAVSVSTLFTLHQFL